MIKVATDCSGIEAPIQALNNLEVKYKHVWSSEVDPRCIQMIRDNYDPDIIYTDMTERDQDKLPEIDLYVCGFPCQPFSNMGKRKGTRDIRGKIFYSVLETIKSSSPKIFILENVKGLVNMKGTFDRFLSMLQKISGYNIYYHVLNARDYGLPQNRERLYIVGILDKYEKYEFEFPEPYDYEVNITDILDEDKKYKESNLTEAQLKNKNIWKSEGYKMNTQPYIFRNGRDPPFLDMSPCLMTSGNRLIISNLNRELTNQELLKIQGFDPNLKTNIPESCLRKQIGNSMAVNVIQGIIKNALVSINKL